MKKIEDYITDLNNAQSAQEAFDVLTKSMKDFGYDRVAYGFATDHASLGLTRQHGHATSFPDEWMAHYIKNNLIEIDPIPNYVLQSALPSFWSPIRNSTEGKSLQILRDASDCGLKDGAIIPLYSKGGEIAGLSVSSDCVNKNPSYEDLAKMQFLGTFFHERYKDFITSSKPVELTDRELQILIWASEGKTDGEIASIIYRSEAAIRYHWKSIFKKLDSYGKVAAVTKAIRLQLITPYHILKNYQN